MYKYTSARLQCVSMCLWEPEINKCVFLNDHLFFSFLFLFLRQGFSRTLKLDNLARLADQQAVGMLLSAPAKHWDYLRIAIAIPRFYFLTRVGARNQTQAKGNYACIHSQGHLPNLFFFILMWLLENLKLHLRLACTMLLLYGCEPSSTKATSRRFTFW